MTCQCNNTPITTPGTTPSGHQTKSKMSCLYSLNHEVERESFANKLITEDDPAQFGIISILVICKEILKVELEIEML